MSSGKSVNRLRVVPDTNILISAYFWKGNEHRLLELARDGKVRFILSSFILDELRMVLDRFGVEEHRVNEYLELLKKMAVTVNPRTFPKVVENDPSDDMLFATTIAGEADMIVSGDKGVLSVLEHLQVKVVRTRRLLELLGRNGL